MTLNYQYQACLQAFNSLAIPATAKVLVMVESVAELRAAINFAEQHSLSSLYLGEGSNTVFSSDFDGIVILNRIKGIEILVSEPDRVVLKVGAGESWHELVQCSIKQEWFGLENLALIPGLVGAAPIQNIGAYGVELSERVLEVEVVELETDSLTTLTVKDCEFGYRDSIFKHELADKVVITAVVLELSRSTTVNISYPALSNLFSSPPTPSQVFDAVCEIRASKLPSPDEIPNAGSFFKNPLVNARQHQSLLNEHPTLVSFPVGDRYKLAAAWLIEQAGWKQKSSFGVTVHEQQALVVINPERQSGSRVLEFAHQIQSDVERRYGVELEIEPRVV